MKISLAILINRKCHSHQWFLMWISKMNENSQNCDPVDAATPQGDFWGAGRMQEARWTRKQIDPKELRCIWRNEFCEPSGLHMPVHRMLNSLTWYPIFHVQTIWSLCCRPVYSLTSPPASLQCFSQNYWDAISWAQSPKRSHQIK